MKRIMSGAVLVILAVIPGHTRAQSLGISPSLYPPHEKLVFEANVTNEGLDCAWGFDCSQTPPARPAWIGGRAGGRRAR